MKNIFLGVFFTFYVFNQANAEIIEFNCNYYQLTSSAVDWQTAEDEAVSLGGHLVAINTQAELFLTLL